MSYEDKEILNIFKKKGKYFLNKSIWGLGIVTGDNKNKLSSICLKGMEKIYTGKEIQKYILKSAKNYIYFDRNNLQQVAKDEIYRAEEKLVYKFISNKLTFAYDNTKSLFLNSANILIPFIPSMCIKSILAFLNSTLFQFAYIKLFGEIKILKGNLLELPFPEIFKETDNTISSSVNKILNGNNSEIKNIDSYIFSIYNYSATQIEYIKRSVYKNN